MTDYSAKLPSFRPSNAQAPLTADNIPAAPENESIENLAAKMPAPVDTGALPPPVEPPAIPVQPIVAIEPPAPAAQAQQTAIPAAPAAAAPSAGLQAPAETGQRQYVPIEDPNKPQFDFKVETAETLFKEKDWSDPPINQRYIFHNKMPKCGSTVFQKLLHKLSIVNRFTFMDVYEPGTRDQVNTAV